MTQRIPLENTKRHRLSVYEYASGRYRCVCECGTEVWIKPAMLLHPTRPTKSCGCYRKEVTGELRRSHSMTGTRAYKAWASMKARCYTKSATGYKDYGGRGIAVCAQWRDSFEAFYADMGDCPESHGVDRIDVDGNYEPGNCRWQHKNDQAKNQRKTVRYQGKTMEEWESELGVSRKALYQRFKKRGHFEIPTVWHPETRRFECT